MRSGPSWARFGCYRASWLDLSVLESPGVVTGGAALWGAGWVSQILGLEALGYEDLGLGGLESIRPSRFAPNFYKKILAKKRSISLSNSTLELHFVNRRGGDHRMGPKRTKSVDLAPSRLASPNPCTLTPSKSKCSCLNAFHAKNRVP